MSKQKEILLVIPTYNEEGKIDKVLGNMGSDVEYDVLVINDGSVDNTLHNIKKYDVKIIDHERNMGVGTSIREGIKYCIDNDYSIMVVMAGNGKDDPREIHKLLKPITEEGYDYVQGSRFLSGGKKDNLPLFRYLVINIYSLIFRFLTGFPCTDVTNGFRAYRISIFQDDLIDIWQDWLGQYELEYYIHYKVLTLGYKVKEVSVSKTYPKDKRGYSKIRYTNWWSIIRPTVYLALGIKK